MPTKEPRNRMELWGIKKIEGRRAFWTRIGTAFENHDGSWNLLFDYYPTGDSTVQMRPPREATTARSSSARRPRAR